MIAKVLINRNIDSLNREFSYKIPNKMDVKIGARVIVPFGKSNSKIVGIVTGICDDEDESIKLKPILELIDSEPLIDDKDIKLANFISKKTYSNIFESLKLFLPPMDLNSIEKKLYSIKSWELIDERNMDKEFIHKKIADGEFRYRFSLKNQQTMYSKNVLFIKKQVEKLPSKQSQVYDLISRGKYTRAEIRSKLNLSDSPIKSLISKGLIGEKIIYDKKRSRDFDYYKKHELNQVQNEVFSGVLLDYRLGKNKFLLNGVTGSGKTEVYLQIVEEFLKQDKSAIILVPEIGLTPQTVSRFKGRFGEDVAIIHSRLTAKEKYDQWMRIKNGDVRLAVGPRSAIFAPMQNLGIIIIDEEHDSSYVSSHNPKYRTIDIAEYRADLNNAMLLLGSATPSLESFFKAKKGIYTLYEMKERANGKELPKIEVIDMAMELSHGNTSIFSLPMYEAIINNLKHKRQTMIFLNRRGYSGFISCRSCGEAIKCQNCDVSMTYHKSENCLMCHYCGKKISLPEKCPQCGSRKIKDFGIGTEQVEYITKKMFPNAKVARMDRDTTSKKNSHYEIWEKMNSGKIDILIGTQMIAKGLDFKNVTLVCILAADMLLKLPDYRSGEWTYSLIRQVSGRAGRGELDGRVLLQTYQPEHFAIKLSVEGDYENFFNQELAIRKEFLYPPFTKIVLIQKNSTNNLDAHNTLIEIYKDTVKYVEDNKLPVKVLHPNPSPISKIKNKYRWQFIIKTKENELDNLIEFLRFYSNKDISVSIDPINMM